MSKEQAHSELPWKIHRRTGTLIESHDGLLVSGCRTEDNTASKNEANAAFIVTACNAHYELVEALEAAIEAFEIEVPVNAEPLPQMRAALAKARRQDQ